MTGPSEPDTGDEPLDLGDPEVLGELLDDEPAAVPSTVHLVEVDEQGNRLEIDVDVIETPPTGAEGADET